MGSHKRTIFCHWGWVVTVFFSVTLIVVVFSNSFVPMKSEYNGQPFAQCDLLLNDFNGKNLFSKKTFNRNIIFSNNSKIYFVLMQYQILLIVKIRIQEKTIIVFL